MLHTHSFTYHPRYIMFLSQHFSFPLSVPLQHCSVLSFQKDKCAKRVNLQTQCSIERLSETQNKCKLSQLVVPVTHRCSFCCHVTAFPHTSSFLPNPASNLRHSPHQFCWWKLIHSSKYGTKRGSGDSRSSSLVISTSSHSTRQSYQPCSSIFMGSPRSTVSLPALLSCLKFHLLLRGRKIHLLTMANCFYTKFIAANYFEHRQYTELRGTIQVSGTLLCGKGQKCTCHQFVKVITALLTIFTMLQLHLPLSCKGHKARVTILLRPSLHLLPFF